MTLAHLLAGVLSLTHSSDIEYPLNAVNSFFPIDAQIQFNTTDHGNVTHHSMTARYASFSPILEKPLTSHYDILHTDGCTPLNQSHSDRIVVVLRGECTFVTKVANIVDAGARAIIVANDEPKRGLVTMYSPTFNQDGSMRVPVMFLTHEDYTELQNFANSDIQLSLNTASLGSWLSVLLSMILSPPLLILALYLAIVLVQKHKKHQENLRSSRLVRQLPVYLYNGDHLVREKNLGVYLERREEEREEREREERETTDQERNTNTNANTHTDSHANTDNTDFPTTDSISSRIPSSSNHPLKMSQSEKSKVTAPSLFHSSSSESVNSGHVVYPWIRELAIRSPGTVLCAPTDYYPSYKCSICLDRYVPMKSRILILHCKHFYHEACLSNWLINFRRSCPLCNGRVGDAVDLERGPLLGHGPDYGSTSQDRNRLLPTNEHMNGSDTDHGADHTDHVYHRNVSSSSSRHATDSGASSETRNSGGSVTHMVNIPSRPEHAILEGNERKKEVQQLEDEQFKLPGTSKHEQEQHPRNEQLPDSEPNIEGTFKMDAFDMENKEDASISAIDNSEPLDTMHKNSELRSSPSTAYFSAKSKLDERRPRFFEHPSHILSQYRAGGEKNLSTSIDSHVEVRDGKVKRRSDEEIH